MPLPPQPVKKRAETASAESSESIFICFFIAIYLRSKYYWMIISQAPQNFNCRPALIVFRVCCYCVRKKQVSTASGQLRNQTFCPREHGCQLRTGYFVTRAIVSLAITSSSFVGITYTSTLESGFEILPSLPLIITLFRSSSIFTPINSSA